MNNTTNTTSFNVSIYINGNSFEIKETQNILKTKTAYEVLKTIGGKPLFFEEHYNRLVLSTLKAQLPEISSIKVFRKAIETLVNHTNSQTGNIEITVSEYNSVIRFIPHFYPTPKQYINGIRTKPFYAERFNPNAKIKNLKLKKRVLKFIKKNKIYEALLVSSNGNITEGSRSNLFIIQDNKIITPPNNQVLKGITRQKIIELCTKNNIEILEIPIYKSQLKTCDAAFLSGTSPGMIPIAMIGNYKKNPNHPILSRLSELYNQNVRDDIENSSN
ncbi:MAG: aminotransferase class IV [Salinivirgaceae bacterium]|nr:aminotransferase class IV [Salinivirgaceae bacterium]